MDDLHATMSSGVNEVSMYPKIVLENPHLTFCNMAVYSTVDILKILHLKDSGPFPYEKSIAEGLSVLPMYFLDLFSMFFS